MLRRVQCSLSPAAAQKGKTSLKPVPDLHKKWCPTVGTLSDQLKPDAAGGAGGAGAGVLLIP